MAKSRQFCGANDNRNRRSHVYCVLGWLAWLMHIDTRNIQATFVHPLATSGLAFDILDALGEIMLFPRAANHASHCPPSSFDTHIYQTLLFLLPLLSPLLIVIITFRLFRTYLHMYGEPYTSAKHVIQGDKLCKILRSPLPMFSNGRINNRARDLKRHSDCTLSVHLKILKIPLQQIFNLFAFNALRVLLRIFSPTFGETR